MAKEVDEFLESGLTHYLSTLRAVRRFEETIRQHLSQVLRRHAVAGSRVLYATGKGAEPYVQCSQRITLGPTVQASVTTGLDWEDGTPYFYVYCDEGPSWAIHPVGARFVRVGGTTYFVEEDAPQGSVPERIERLFDEWLVAVNKASTNVKAT